MKVIKILLLFLLISTLSGCADYRELSDMAIVSSFGIDKVDDEYRITSQILDSKQKSEGDTGSTTPEIVVYNSTGKTLHEAIRNATLQAPKKLYVGHVETVIISENFAKENISEMFDFFLRDVEASKDFNILLAKDYSITDIMDILTPLETIPASNIASSIEIATKLQGSTDEVTFEKFVSNVLKTGIDAVIPVVTIEEEKSENEEINPKKRLALTKEFGVFKKDKFLTYISEDASLGYNLLNMNVDASVISFKCDKERYASMELVSNKSKISYDIKKNTLNTEVNLKGALSELNCDMELTKEKDAKKLEKELETRLHDIVEETINEAIKNYKSDFLGVGQSIFQNNYKYYQKNKDNIEDIIKNMKRNIKIKAEFIQKGSIKRGDEKY